MPINPIDLHDSIQLVRLHAIQLAAYRIEAGLIGSMAIPALGETLETLRIAPASWFGAWRQGQMCGAIALEVHLDIVEIAKLLVDPVVSRQGIGTDLLAYALAAFPGYTFKVATGARNTPAKRLYAKFGFKQMVSRTTPEGIEVVLWVLYR